MLIRKELYARLDAALPQLDGHLHAGPSVRRVKRLAEVLDDGKPAITQLVTLAAAALAAAEATERERERRPLISSSAIAGA